MSVARFVIFIVVMVLVLGGINAQAFRWARNAFRLRSASQRCLTTLLVLSLAGMVLGRLADRFWPSTVTHFVVLVASTVQLAAVISGILLLLAEVVRVVWRLPSAIQAS